jgi:hypothetical protein
MKHICNYCNYETLRKENYERHLLSLKHKKNINDSNEDLNRHNNIVINKIDNLSKQNEEVLRQNEEVIKQNEELRREIERLKELNSQNTNKIVKEARAIKKSILTILNTNFKDTPSIDYIDEKEFQKELELEYKAKITNKEDKLFMRIFNDFKNKKIVQTLSSLILKFVKKEDQKIQSVFNIDSARGNYATKIENFWHNDKSGLQLKKYTLDVIIRYMLKVMDIYRQKIVDMYNENKIKKDSCVTDYIMEYQGLLFEVNSYLTNSNTHKKIIIHMCPELRLDNKLLDTIT